MKTFLSLRHPSESGCDLADVGLLFCTRLRVGVFIVNVQVHRASGLEGYELLEQSDEERGEWILFLNKNIWHMVSHNLPVFTSFDLRK